MSNTNTYTVLEGKTFSVDLTSHYGSSNYGWFLSYLPKGIILLGTDCLPTAQRMTVIQHFEFGVISSEETEVSLEFVLTCVSNMQALTDTYKVDVQIVPANSDEYASYSENASQAAIPYGYVYGGDSTTAVKYGYPCGLQDANSDDYPRLKYGYPCGLQDAAGDDYPRLKYGYPCGVQDAAGDDYPRLKYGYPCGLQDAAGDDYPRLKYGYPCGLQDAASADYPRLKYGYPCGLQDAMADQIRTFYGFPRVAYGFPNCR